MESIAVRRSESFGRAPPGSHARQAPAIAARMLAYFSPLVFDWVEVMESFAPNWISQTYMDLARQLSTTPPPTPPPSMKIPSEWRRREWSKTLLASSTVEIPL